MKTVSIHRNLSTILAKSNEVVACNIYVSAGGRSHHAKPLLNLLKSTQEKCRQLRSNGTGNGNTNIVNCSRTTLSPRDLAAESTSSRNVERERHQRIQNKIAVIHAYADGPYNRSSFHIAGNADCVCQIASHIALGAIDFLSCIDANTGANANANANNSKEENGGDNLSRNVSSSNDDSTHPLVGLVDHISVMPLSNDIIETGLVVNDKPNKENPDVNAGADVDLGKDNITHTQTNSSSATFIPPDVHGMVARSIANVLDQLGVKIETYASADPDNTPLAIVRKQKTSFFKSGGLTAENDNTENDNEHADKNEKHRKITREVQKNLGVCTVGSPPCFVENYNVRLTKNISKKQAMRLTKKVRERDGGIVGVEALTLPYSNDRYETACNLLRPGVGSANDIETVVEEWIDEENALLRDKNGNDGLMDVNSKLPREYFVDDAYRVGTTVSQCTAVLDITQLESKVADHDTNVLDGFRIYLNPVLN
uniref:Formiminotransferase N-terminal subdomain domain-containing protein n=1 Tax=Chaetoceros debilis TaxID=122233 RepID=A0A7S3V976_9STRA